MKSDQAISLINSLGKGRIPFLLITDFEAEKIKVQQLDQLGEGILYDINGATNHALYREASAPAALKVAPMSFREYYHQFDRVLHEINYGNSFLLNLTGKHAISTELSLLDIFSVTKAKYKILMEDNFVVFSPETFVIIQDQHIASYPMKGTIDASLPDAKNVLLNNEKEKAEHYTIVDLIRNDLSIYAKEVAVSKFRYLDLITSNNKDLYQVSSEIVGKLPENYHELLGDIIFSMLPAGSISGAPKKKTVEIISETESQKRGYYTGICGLYDGQKFDSFVMIRYIENTDDQLWYRSGGGITFQSEVEQEYQEMIDKIYLPL